ncbi:hypothetical protein DFQ28_011090 [Apophysomyces sp. BC1034]|nr:hypothetical protein DFQ28_011090 [Apophysomyces sp. BC1034]
MPIKRIVDVPQEMRGLDLNPDDPKDKRRFAGMVGRENAAVYGWIRRARNVSKPVERLLEALHRLPAESARKKRQILESIVMEVAEGAGRSGIKVAVVLFCKPGCVPERISVREITLPLDRAIRGYTTGLSGHQCLDGMMYARQYADAKRLEMIVIDLLVDFTQPLYPKMLPPERVAEHDVLNLFRASKSLIAEIAAHWKEWVKEEEGEAAENQYNWLRPIDFVARRPNMLPRLLKLKQFSHINVVTHPVFTTYSDRALTVTSFRVDYPYIEQASARFHPDIEVVL